LQYISHEEGRIREIRTTDSNSNVIGYNFDYFIKDHLGNIRMVLTDEQKIEAPIAAGMETRDALTENQLYYNIDNTRYTVTSTYPDYNATNNTAVSKNIRQ